MYVYGSRNGRLLPGGVPNDSECNNASTGNVTTRLLLLLALIFCPQRIIKITILIFGQGYVEPHSHLYYVFVVE